MHPRYPDLQFSWKMHTFKNPESPIMSPIFPGEMKVKILEGKMKNHEKLIEDLYNIVMTQEQRLVKHTDSGSDPDAGTMLDDHHLTTRFSRWNTFYVSHPAVEMLWNFISQAHDKYLEELNLRHPKHTSIQSWANVLRKNDTISEHAHYQGHPHYDTAPHSYLSCNFCVTANEDTSTVYNLPGNPHRVAEFPNSPGQLTMFPIWVPHFTTKFERENDERITIAADVSTHSWRENSFSNGERDSHWVDFAKSPQARLREKNHDQIHRLKDIDPVISHIVNHDGELTESDIETYVEQYEEKITEEVHQKPVNEPNN